MSEKKRKASSAPDSRPQKKQQTTSAATVEHIQSSDILKPVIGTREKFVTLQISDAPVASTPGASFPDVRFQSFSKKPQHGSQMLIHSSEHPTIDYTAAEGTEPNEAHLKHYVAVFDPATNKLKVTEAKRLTVRGALRQRPKLEESEDEDTQNFLASQGTRSALTEAFGSKKSKKAVQSIAENRQLGQGQEGATIANVMASHIADDEDEEEPATATAIARSNKPLPQPNLTTNDIEEVYSLSTLVQPSPASTTLRNMPIEQWRARMKANKEVIGLRSRYIANRVTYIGKRVLESNDPRYVQQFQLLRYIELLVEIAQFAGKQDRRRRMKFVDEWPEHTLTQGVPPTIVKETVNHFFPDNTPSDRAMTLLKTTIFALTLHILPPSGKTGGAQLVAEPTDIQLDLAMEAPEVRRLYHELGCKVAPATDKDLTSWGYTKLVDKKKKKTEDGMTLPKPQFAVLKFPLNFPKASGQRRTKR